MGFFALSLPQRQLDVCDHYPNGMTNVLVMGLSNYGLQQSWLGVYACLFVCGCAVGLILCFNSHISEEKPHS